MSNISRRLMMVSKAASLTVLPSSRASSTNSGNTTAFVCSCLRRKNNNCHKLKKTYYICNCFFVFLFFKLIEVHILRAFMALIGLSGTVYHKTAPRYGDKETSKQSKNGYIIFRTESKSPRVMTFTREGNCMLTCLDSACT